MPDHAHLLLAAFILVPLYAIADRMVGGAGKRSVAFLSVLLISAGLAFLLQDWALLVMAATWMGYRSLPFAGPFGSTTPHGFGILTTLFRHTLPALVAIACEADKLFAADWTMLAIALAAYAVVATLLALVYAALTDNHKSDGTAGGSENSFIEIIRGAAYGAALAIWAAVMVGT